MRTLLAVCAATTLGMTGIAQAQSPIAAQLAGKTCVGTFDTGLAYQQNGRGAFVLRFELEGGALVASHSSNLGETAYQRGARWVKNDAVTATAWSDVVSDPDARVQDLRVDGQTISFWTSKRNYFSLQLNQQGKFVGTVDPRQNP